MEPEKFLFRYTTLPFLLDYLERKKLTLLNPENWDDKNDTEIIRAYVQKTKFAKILALCFTEGTESLHHWKTYSDGTSGCRIEFDKEKFDKILKNQKGIKYGKVSYKKIKETENNSVGLEEYPFTKREPYQVEKEFRIIKECSTEDEQCEISVPLDVVTRITFAFQLPYTVFKIIKEMLIQQYEIPKGKIYQSTLYGNKKWIGNFK